MRVAPEKLVDLYEQVVKEMVEAREVDTARMLLRSTVPMAMLRQEDPDRRVCVEPPSWLPSWSTVMQPWRVRLPLLGAGTFGLSGCWPGRRSTRLRCTPTAWASTPSALIWRSRSKRRWALSVVFCRLCVVLLLGTSMGYACVCLCLSLCAGGCCSVVSLACSDWPLPEVATALGMAEPQHCWTCVAVLVYSTGCDEMPPFTQGLLPKGMVYDVFRAAVPSKHDLKEKAAKKLVRSLPARS